MNHLPKQFRVSRKSMSPLPGWRETKLGGLTVSSSPELPVIRIVRSGETVGLVLGWFSIGERFFCSDGEWLLVDSIETTYADMCGRFVILHLVQDDVEVMTDAGAMLPVVYDEAEGTVASTSTVLSLQREIGLCAEVQNACKRADGRVWYPFGLTPYDGVVRLLPGHARAISSGVQRRVASTKIESGGTSETIRAIVDRVVENVVAISSGGATDAHLTAGCDSRMVLAACVAAKLKPDCVTIATPSSGARLDVAIAAKLAALVGVNHRAIEFLSPAKDELRDWQARTGHCIEDSVSSLCRTVKAHDNGRFTMSGLSGEVGRCFFWEDKDIRARGLSPKELVERMGFAATPLLLERASSWLDELGDLATTELLDQAYIDHRLGGWAGPSAFGHDVDKPTLSPFNSRRLYDLMMSLPEEYRWRGEFCRDFIAQAAPPLNSLPYNRPVGRLRLKFWREEVKQQLPNGLKRWLKSFRRSKQASPATGR